MFDLVNTEDIRFLECPCNNIFGELNVSGFDSAVNVNQLLASICLHGNVREIGRASCRERV